MSMTVGDLVAKTVTFPRSSLSDSAFGTEDGCGKRNYVLTDADNYKGFFTLEQMDTDVKLVLLSLNNADVGVYSMTISASLEDFS
jgi:hypothetical protein